MSTRSRQSHQLAAALTEHFGVPFTAVCTGERDRHGNGYWRLSWSDGPTVETAVAEIGRRAGQYPAVEVERLGFWRGNTDRAQAAALLAWLPQHPDHVEFLNSFTVDSAFDETEFPERLDEQLQRRASALLRAGSGWLSQQAIGLLAEHCRLGWEQAEQWLDGLTAVDEGLAGDNVVDLTAVRKRRQQP